MNLHLSSLSSTQLRNLHIEESKKFNDAINLGSSIHELEIILAYIKDLEIILQNKELGEIPRISQAVISPNDTAHRNIA